MYLSKWIRQNLISLLHGLLRFQGFSASDKVLRDKAFNIAKNPKYDRYQCGLPSMVYRFFDKKSSGRAVTCAQSENLATRD